MREGGMKADVLDHAEDSKSNDAPARSERSVQTTAPTIVKVVSKPPKKRSSPARQSARSPAPSSKAASARSGASHSTTSGKPKADRRPSPVPIPVLPVEEVDPRYPHLRRRLLPTYRGRPLRHETVGGVDRFVDDLGIFVNKLVKEKETEATIFRRFSKYGHIVSLISCATAVHR